MLLDKNHCHLSEDKKKNRHKKNWYITSHHKRSSLAYRKNLQHSKPIIRTTAGVAGCPVRLLAGNGRAGDDKNKPGVPAATFSVQDQQKEDLPMLPAGYRYRKVETEMDEWNCDGQDGCWRFVYFQAKVVFSRIPDGRFWTLRDEREREIERQPEC